MKTLSRHGVRNKKNVYCCYPDFVLTGTAQTTDGCPAALTRDEHLAVYGDHCYEFITTHVLDYTTAEKYCTNHGGTLLLVKSKDVSDYVIDKLVLDFNNANKIWIGLSDRLKEGTYVWEDGSPLGDYTNWAPDNGPLNNSTSGTLQDCVTLDPNKNGRWEEDACANPLFGLFLHERPFVCQYRVRASVTSGPA